jgi:hypothetical protein
MVILLNLESLYESLYDALNQVCFSVYTSTGRGGGVDLASSRINLFVRIIQWFLSHHLVFVTHPSVAQSFLLRTHDTYVKRVSQCSTESHGFS